MKITPEIAALIAQLEYEKSVVNVITQIHTMVIPLCRMVGFLYPFKYLSTVRRSFPNSRAI